MSGKVTHMSPYQLENKFPNQPEIILFLCRNIFQFWHFYQLFGYNLVKILCRKKNCVGFCPTTDREDKIEKYFCKETILFFIYLGIYFLADKAVH